MHIFPILKCPSIMCFKILSNCTLHCLKLMYQRNCFRFMACIVGIVVYHSKVFCSLHLSLCLYAIFRDDEVCVSMGGLVSNSFTNTGDESQLSSVDGDAGSELGKNDNNNSNHNNSKFITA